MRKLIVTAFVSLDGVMQAPGGPDEDSEGGFSLGGWTFPYLDAVFGEIMGGMFSQPFDLLLGRRTYDIFAAHWPRVPPGHDDYPIAERFNGINKYVATHRPHSLTWQNSEPLGDDALDRVAALKRMDGRNLMTQGSSTLIHQLMATDLVDELTLLTYPVMLGRGKRLFDTDGRPAAFRLVESRPTTTGVLTARYQREGPVRTGSFALDA